VTFEQVQNGFDGADAVKGEYLVSSLRACTQDFLKNMLLQVEGFIKARARVETNLADVTSVWKIFIPNRQFVSSLKHQLRMQLFLSWIAPQRIPGRLRADLPSKQGSISISPGVSFRQSGPMPIIRLGAISRIGPRANMRCGSAAGSCPHRSRVRGCAAFVAHHLTVTTRKKAIHTVDTSTRRRPSMEFSDEVCG
jgi:hypothetical protein